MAPSSYWLTRRTLGDAKRDLQPWVPPDSATYPHVSVSGSVPVAHGVRGLLAGRERRDLGGRDAISALVQAVSGSADVRRHDQVRRRPQLMSRRKRLRIGHVEGGRQAPRPQLGEQ